MVLPEKEKMAVGEATIDMSKTLKSSLPPMEDMWKFITEKVKEAVSGVGGFFSSTWEKVRESPVVKQVVDYAEDGVNAIAPCVKKGVEYAEDGASTIASYVKIGVDYSVEKVQQHPYLAGSIALLLLSVLLCKFCCGSGVRAGGKMMKAPGAGYMMLRADFDSSPKAYFQGLRGKTVFDGTKLV